MFLQSTTILLIVFQSIKTTIGDEDCIHHTLRKRVNECCIIPAPFPATALRECDRKARRDNTVAKYVVDKCTMECYYQKLNIIDENTLLMDKVNLYLESLEVPAREFYKAVFQTCDDQLMEVKEHKLVTICSTFAADMNQCVRKFVNQRCPEQYFRETELCNQVKAGREFCMK